MGGPATGSVVAMSGSGGHIVLVPYHSGIAHLTSALVSLIGQTDPGWRAVVIDDSPDDADVTESASACARAVSGLGDERISLERPVRRLGVAGAFNRCFALAAASDAAYAVVLHADDELEPGYLEAVAAVHRRQPEAACVAPRVKVIDDVGAAAHPLGDRVKAAMWPRQADRLTGDRGLARLLHGQFLYCPSVSFRTDVVATTPWDGRWQQVMDLDLFARILLSGRDIALCDEPVYRYRRHPLTTTSRNTATLVRLEEETRLCRQLASAAAEQGWRSAARAGRLRTTVRLHGLLQALGHLRSGHSRLAVSAVALSLGR